MNLRKALYSSALLIPIVLGGIIGSASTTPAMSEQLTGRLHRHIPIIVKERRNSATTSTNWSGYAVTGDRGSVTDVKGSWVVPAVTCGSGNQYASFWIGIDGYNSNTVEQIGTDSDCQGGTPTYYAWYEFYPHWSVGIPMTISNGNVISAEVSTTGGAFTVSLTNTTTNDPPFITRAKMNKQQRSSAEWIAEAPWSGGVLPLANFVQAKYGVDYTAVADTATATVNGVTKTLSDFGNPNDPASPVQQITMVTSSGTPKAVPSGLSNSAAGSSFTITWKNAGP